MFVFLAILDGIDVDVGLASARYRTARGSSRSEIRRSAMQCGVRDLLAPSSQEGWKALAANGPMQTDVVILRRAVADHRFLVSKKTVILHPGNRSSN